MQLKAVRKRFTEDASAVRLICPDDAAQSFGRGRESGGVEPGGGRPGRVLVDVPRGIPGSSREAGDRLGGVR